MVAEFKDFKDFLKHPNLSQEKDINSVNTIIKLTWVSLLIIIGVGFIISTFVTTPLFLLDFMPRQRRLELSPMNILRISLVAPIIEELIYRLPLKLTRRNFTISFGVLLFILVRKVDIIYAFSATALFLGFMIVSVRKFTDFQSNIKQLVNKYFYVVFYFQAIMFGVLHLFNFNLDYKYFYLFPFYVLNYIFIGFFLGYIRVRFKHGIYVCILTHMSMNSLYCIIFSLFG